MQRVHRKSGFAQDLRKQSALKHPHLVCRAILLIQRGIVVLAMVKTSIQLVHILVQASAHCHIQLLETDKGREQEYPPKSLPSAKAAWCRRDSRPATCFPAPERRCSGVALHWKGSR